MVYKTSKKHRTSKKHKTSKKNKTRNNRNKSQAGGYAHKHVEGEQLIYSPRLKTKTKTRTKTRTKHRRNWF